MNKQEVLDVFIIGAGPIGLACGIEASTAGLSYLVADKGCLTNSIYNYPLNMAFFSTSERLEIGNVPFVSHHYKPNRTEALEYYRRVAMHWKLNVKLYCKVTDIIEENGIYKICTDDNDYYSKAIIVATGFFDIPNRMNVKGEELAKVHHYYKEPYPYYGQKIVVVGSANSAVDVALETYRKGAEVTMIIRDDKISDRVKYWVKPDIENRIKEESIKAYFNSSLSNIKPKEVDIITSNGKVTIANDFVLAMTGYTPDFSLLLNAGITVSNDEFKRPVYNPDTMETNCKNIYLAGVICGGLETYKWFIENSRIHATMIISNITKKKK